MMTMNDHAVDLEYVYPPGARSVHEPLPMSQLDVTLANLASSDARLLQRVSDLESLVHRLTVAMDQLMADG
jgi:hypothetical protein